MRSGFVAILGRPNVGKSSLLNAICGQKVSIVSDKVQTTRRQVRGILHGKGYQIVFLDTPGVHKPVSELGVRANAAALSASPDSDVVVQILDGRVPVGKGDIFVNNNAGPKPVIVVNKIDRLKPTQLAKRLKEASTLKGSEFFPLSAKTGEGVKEFLSYLKNAMPEGPPYYDETTIRDMDEADHVAELVREKLLEELEEELPHSIATAVSEIDWPYIKIVIFVERNSQKGIIIGAGGERLKRVGSAVRAHIRDGAYLDLQVKVEKDWSRRAYALDRLGY